MYSPIRRNTKKQGNTSAFYRKLSSSGARRWIFCYYYLSSPWYNRTGWLGVKHQLTYLSVYLLAPDEDWQFSVESACVSLFPCVSSYRFVHFPSSVLFWFWWLAAVGYGEACDTESGQHWRCFVMTRGTELPGCCRVSAWSRLAHAATVSHPLATAARLRGVWVWLFFLIWLGKTHEAADCLQMCYSRSKTLSPSSNTFSSHCKEMVVIKNTQNNLHCAPPTRFGMACTCSKARASHVQRPSGFRSRRTKP